MHLHDVAVQYYAHSQHHNFLPTNILILHHSTYSTYMIKEENMNFKVLKRYEFKKHVATKPVTIRT